MKKFRVLAFSLLAVMLLTGCGSKTLTCTKTEDSSGISMEQEITMKFKSKKVSNVKVSVDSKATDDTIKQNWDMFASILGSQYTEKDENGVKISTENDEKNYSYKISIELDLEKASDDVLEEYGFDGIVGKSADIDQVKANAEKDGYTCK